ncbi:DNA methylase N-4/N-6 domain-containing protein [Caballeronia pedi]|uniref:Methyltransferase n=1 Tax=Caballeronia pedi TaxID=1777141 RepID=A0A158DW55_9BURK|nr:site-specific DNA-methyltransferase [Caballeronia pedi]SAK98426.1 DNA methylase N-4/N-6 domain-containing protein [Caballeronia pedi]
MSERPYALHLGDCLDVLATLADASVDSIVTDPPYHLTSNARGSHKPGEATTPHLRARIGDRGFMGKEWDGGDIAQRVEMWAQCLRVLKPGGHLVAFSGSRTYHRMACAIEDAGFEIRDQIMWLYGSGFPKSRNIGDGRGTALKPAHEPICFARKPLVGTVEANVLQHGTGALNIDACRVEPTGESQARDGEASQARRYTEQGGTNFAALPGVRGGDPSGRWPANVIHDGSDEVLEAFPDAPGQIARSSSSARKTQNVYGAMVRGSGGIEPRAELDKSAARFFYCAKASRADRNEGLPSSDVPAVTQGATMRDCETADWSARNGNTHPTVKPTDLMAYLCRLVTPAGGIVLDPFMGSGSTGKAAMREGFRFVGIDMTPEYVDIARARIEASWQAAEAVRKVCAPVPQLDLFEEQAA